MILKLSLQHQNGLLASKQALAYMMQNALRLYTPLNISYALNLDDDKLIIELASSDENALLELANKLGSLLASGLFKEEISAKVIADKALNKSSSFNEFKSYSFCPSCKEASKQCEICNQLIPNQEVQKNAILIADKLANKKIIKVCSKSGEHVFSTTPSNHVYCTNLEAVLKVAKLSQKELEALISYEKPILKVRASEEFNNLIKHDEIWLSYAHDLEQLEIFNALKKLNIDSIYSADESLVDESFKLAKKIASPLSALILENDRALVLHNPLVREDLKSIFNEAKSASEGFLKTILEENKLASKNILHFHLSRFSEDKISLYVAASKQVIGVLDLSLPKDLNSLFELIKQENSGAKLLENYFAKFPSTKALYIDFKKLKNNFYSLWHIIARVLEIDEDLLSLANKNLRLRGMAIDYAFKFINEASTNYISAPTSPFANANNLANSDDLRLEFLFAKCLRSCMCFRLANAPTNIIALGCIDSFAQMLHRISKLLCKRHDIYGYALSGDLLDNKMLGDFIYKYMRNERVFRNIYFPIYHE